MEDYRLSQTGQEVQDILNGAAMQADLNAEVERATEAEGRLQGNIDSEERARQDADGLLQQGISDEENRAKRAEEANAGDIADIKALIPSTATGENKLVDVNQMNSSIATATATYRGNYNLVTDLHLAIDATHAQIETLLGTVIAEADNNDYCYVMVPTSAETPTQIAKIERYKFNGTAWAFEYDVNNSGFTAAQWAAINSGITSGLVAKLNALPSNTDLLALLAGKQDVLTFDDVPVEGSNNVVKSGGVHSAIDDEKTARVNNVNTLQGEIDGIEGKIPSGASSANKLVDTATMESAVSTATATFRGDYNLVSDLHLAIDATHAQIATMLASEISTADNNDYAYVEIPTNAETPAQIACVERYKFNGTEWGYEYTLNNSGFTANQWAAINSMITSGLVDKLMALPTNSDLLALLAQKQDVLTFDQTPTENSTHPVTSGGVYAADKALSDAIEAILLLIPSAATSLNKLVDTALMNSSISTATATFRGTYNLVSDLGLGIDATELQIAAALLSNISTADNNDYAFVLVPTSAETPAQIARTDRYKYNGTAWAFEYTLNTSGFTAAQWAAINSTITSALVAKLSDLPTAAELQESLGILTTGINGINAKIPASAASNNKLVDASTMESYIAQVIDILDATFNVTSTDGHITLHITQVDGVITSVQVQSTDIASAADLALKASQADLTALASRVTTAEGNITSLTGRMGTAETNISALQSLYSGLTQSNIIIGSLPASGSANIIYRVPGTSSYSDYMWNGSSFILMATYSDYDFSAMAEIKEAVYTWKLEDGVLNGYINSSGVFAEGSSWRVKYIKVEEGDLIDFYGHVNGSYRAGYTDNVPTSRGFSLSTILPIDTVSPIIASRSGYFCISDYWDGSFTVQLKAKVKLKDVWDKFPKKLEVAPEVTTGYITLSGDIAEYGSKSFRCDNYLLTAGKEYIVYCTDITAGLGGNYYFGFALSKNKPSADGAFAFKLYDMRDIDTIKIVPAVNTYLVINQGYNYLGRALFKIFAGESYAATGLEIADIKEQLNSSYKGKNCIYIGDSISTNNNCIWKGLIESEYGLSYVRNISGQLAPADGGITLMPPQTESSELSQKSIWYRCAANRMNIYTFDVISLMGGVNDMTNSELIIGTIDDLPYVDDASSFSDPTAVTDIWVNNLTFAQALMGCIEMLKRDFPTKEIIIDTVIPCSGNYGNWTDLETGLKGSEAIAELQVRVAEKYGLKVAPMYWSARTSENAGRRVFATDGVHPNLAFATIMKTIFADSLGI